MLTAWGKSAERIDRDCTAVKLFASQRTTAVDLSPEQLNIRDDFFWAKKFYKKFAEKKLRWSITYPDCISLLSIDQHSRCLIKSNHF